MSEIYDLKCRSCNIVLGTTSLPDASDLICTTCSIAEDALFFSRTKPPTLADRITALESDIVKVTTVMVSKGDLLAKDIAVAVEAGAVEEPLEP